MFNEDRKKESAWALFGEFFLSALVMAGILLSIRVFVIQPYVVEGQSMDPTFVNNEYILVEKLSFKLREPKRGEVAIINPDLKMPDLSYIKRIIGLPNERLVIENSHVAIYSQDHPQGMILDEPYLAPSTKTYVKNDSSRKLDVSLGPNEYFVMGDNRANSLDSRTIGVLKQDQLVGRAKFIVFPTAYAGSIPDPSY